MRKLLAGTALALMVVPPLAAQQTTEGTSAASPPAGGATVVLFVPAPVPDALYASDLLGMDIYSSSEDYQGNFGDGRQVSMDLRGQWDDIGSISDIAMSPDGTTRAVIVDVGGFLGIGAHTVALDMNQVHFLRDETNRTFAAVNSSREELEAAPAYERPDQPPMTGTTPGMAPGTMAQTDGAPGMAGSGDALPTEMGPRPALEREGYVDANYEMLRAEQLQGAPVYDASDEHIGSVEQIIVSGTNIQQAVVDIGGFLGMGAHRIALDYDEMQVMTRTDGTDVRVYIDQSREQLEQRPEYEG